MQRYIRRRFCCFGLNCFCNLLLVGLSLCLFLYFCRIWFFFSLRRTFLVQTGLFVWVYDCIGLNFFNFTFLQGWLFSFLRVVWIAIFDTNLFVVRWFYLGDRVLFHSAEDSDWAFRGRRWACFGGCLLSCSGFFNWFSVVLFRQVLRFQVRWVLDLKFWYLVLIDKDLYLRGSLRDFIPFFRYFQACWFQALCGLVPAFLSELGSSQLRGSSHLRLNDRASGRFRWRLCFI